MFAFSVSVDSIPSTLFVYSARDIAPLRGSVDARITALARRELVYAAMDCFQLGPAGIQLVLVCDINER